MRTSISLALALLVTTAPASQRVTTVSFEAKEAGEAVAVLAIDCPGCDWGVEGREGVTLRLELDGEYSQHLVLTRKGKPAYRVMLGPVGIGPHRVNIDLDPALTAQGAGSFAVGRVDVQIITPDAPEYEKLAHAPFLYQRANTIGRFTDTPLLQWVETDTTPAGRRLRYSMIFSNEDGGTPTDRLMATWGRTTDIELIYDVAMDATGRILKEEIQAEGHEIQPFAGPKLGSHPMLWVTTDNNMVSDKGETAVRHALAPLPFALAERSREAVMDANAWTYQVMAAEMAREKKIVPDSKPGTGLIPDLRRYAFVEACGDLTEATAVAFDVGVERDGRVQWYSTDRDMPQFRIARSGCFQAAAPLPQGVSLSMSPQPHLRVRAYRKTNDREPPPSGPVGATIRRVNTVFMLGDDYRPGPAVMKWKGLLTVGPERPVEVPLH